MNKYLKIMSFLFLTLKITLMGQEFDTSVIKNASYYVRKEVFQPTNPEDFHPINVSLLKIENYPKGQTYYYTIHYYTFDGDLRATINFSSSYHFDNSYDFDNVRLHNEWLNKKIDRPGRNPQPVYYKIIYDQDYVIPGYKIYFYDKNNNEIKSYWYYDFVFNDKEYIMLDISIAQDRSVMTDKERKLFFEQKFDDSVIKNASYYICQEVLTEANDKEIFPVTTSAKNSIKGYAYYYTFDGNLLAKINFSCGSRIDNVSDFPPTNKYIQKLDLKALNNKIDRTALKPQAKYYKIVYHKSLKGASGYRIYFYDIHGNFLEWYWYDQTKKLIKAKYGSYCDSYDCTLAFDTSKKEKLNQLCRHFELDLSIVQDRTPQEKKKSLKSIIQDIFD